jgi:hypothetical protein
MATMTMEDVVVETGTSASKQRPVKTITAPEWQKRNKLLPVLHSRAQYVLQMVIGGLPVNEDTNEPIPPKNFTEWLQHVHSEASTYNYTDRVDLLKSTLPPQCPALVSFQGCS